MAITLSDLDFNLASLRNPKVKDCNLSVNVFAGRLQFTIFNNRRVDAKIPVSPWFVQYIKYIWNTRLKTPTPNLNLSVTVSIRNSVTKTYERDNLVIFGYTENNEPYVGVKNDKKQFAHIFLLEQPLDYDTNRTDLDKNELHKIAINTFLETLSSEATIAIRLSKTKQKRQQDQRQSGGDNG